MGYEDWEQLYLCVETSRPVWLDDIVLWLLVGSSILSVFGASFVLVQFMLRSRGHTISRMVALLALNDLFAASTIGMASIWIFAYKNDGAGVETWSLTLCGWVRVLYDFWQHMSMLWTVAIALFLLASVVCFPNFLKGGETLEQRAERMWISRVLVLFSWTASAIVCLIPALINLGINDFESYTSGWCAVTAPLNYIFWDTPIFLSMISVVFLYGILLAFLFRRFSRTWRFNSFDFTVPLRISLISAAFLVCWAPDVLSHFLSFGWSCHFVILDVLSSCGETLQGFLNCFVYTIANRDVRRLASSKRIVLEFFLSPFLLLPVAIYTVYKSYRAAYLPKVRRGSVPSIATYQGGNPAHDAALPTDSRSLSEDEYGIPLPESQNDHYPPNLSLFQGVPLDDNYFDVDDDSLSVPPNLQSLTHSSTTSFGQLSSSFR